MIVYPPDEEGGRMVRVDGHIFGRAFNLWDVLQFLRRSGLPELNNINVVASDLIEWRGGGPELWRN